MSTIDRESAAIVVDCRDHGESDKIITFFTEDRGRITGIAKGALCSKKRFVNKLEIFSLLTISYRLGRQSNLALIADAELHSGFVNLRTSVTLYNRASIIREVILLATVEQQGDAQVFFLLLWALRSLDEKRSSADVVAVFLLRLYDLIGYCPELSICLSCSLPITSQQMHGFDYRTGRLICSNCLGKMTGSTTEMSLGTIKLLQSVLCLPLARMSRLQFSRQALQQSLSMLHNYGRHLFQREIHSWKALAGDLRLPPPHERR